MNIILLTIIKYSNPNVESTRVLQLFLNVTPERCRILKHWQVKPSSVEIQNYSTGYLPSRLVIQDPEQFCLFPDVLNVSLPFVPFGPCRINVLGMTHQECETRNWVHVNEPAKYGVAHNATPSLFTLLFGDERQQNPPDAHDG